MKAAHHDELPRPRLGRGLAALLGDTGPEPEALVRTKTQRRVPIEFLRRNPRNPRTIFDQADLDELSASIKERGIIQPILVRTVPGVADAYEIIAGERRWRAAQQAELHEVPIVTIEADDKQALEIAIIENVQRADLNAMEEAAGYERLLEEFGYSQGDLGKAIGKSRPHINNTLRLLKLPDEVRALVATNQISAGHARALLGSSRPLELANRIVERGLSVRAVEDAVKREAQDLGRPDTPASSRSGKSPDTIALEKRIGERTGLFAEIKLKSETRGAVRIEYESLEQLDMLIARLTG